MKDKGLFIIGDFGYATKKIGGQTIKTRNVHDVLKSKYSIEVFDTGELEGHSIKIIYLFFQTLKYKNIFFIGGQRNLKYFFPLLFIISKFKRSNIVYVAVGGWLYDFLKSNLFFYRYMTKNIKSILVETSYLKTSLLDLGLNNVSWIPNFRVISGGPERKIKASSDVFRMVFMARVTKTKGIYLVFDLIESYLKNTSDFNKRLIVDFYGPIDTDDEFTFRELVNQYSEYVKYKGVLDPSEIYKVLPSYDLLILPTFHDGEGFPGTILDAYLCGLPVIATRWKQLPEFVDENKTGFLIDYDVKQLRNKVQQLANDNDLLAVMKNNAYEKSKEYSSEVGLKILEKAMGL